MDTMTVRSEEEIRGQMYNVYRQLQTVEEEIEEIEDRRLENLKDDDNGRGGYLNRLESLKSDKRFYKNQIRVLQWVLSQVGNPREFDFERDHGYPVDHDIYDMTPRHDERPGDEIDGDGYCVTASAEVWLESSYECTVPRESAELWTERDFNVIMEDMTDSAMPIDYDRDNIQVEVMERENCNHEWEAVSGIYEEINLDFSFRCSKCGMGHPDRPGNYPLEEGK